MSSKPVTEVAYLPLKAGSNVYEASSSAGKIWNETLNTLHGQPGVQRSYWSTQVENPAMLNLFADWENLEAHQTFMKSREYGPFVKNLGSIMDGAPVLIHVPFEPHPPSAALSSTSAPATEVLTLHFPTSLSESDKADVESRMQKLVGVIEKAGAGFKGAAGGWAIEDVEHEGKSTKAFFGVIGWQSVEAHHAVRETEAFKSNIHLLREAPSVQGMTMFHVKNSESQGGTAGAQPIQDEVLNPHGGNKEPPKTHTDGSASSKVGSWGTRKEE